MHVLRFAVVEEQAAVVVVLEMHAVFREQVAQQRGAHGAEVAGVDAVVIRRPGRGVGEEVEQRLRCGGRHRGAHVRHVGHAEILDAPDRRVVDADAFPVAEHGAAGGRRGPLRRRGALAAVLERRAELPLRRAEVRGGHGAGVVCRAALHRDRSHQQRLRHRGARAVLPEKGDVHLAQAEGARDALVQQVAGEDHTDVAFFEPGLADRERGRLRLQHAFRLFPALLREVGVEEGLVEVARERALGLLFAADRRVPENPRAALKENRIFAEPFHEALTLSCKICAVSSPETARSGTERRRKTPRPKGRTPAPGRRRRTSSSRGR